MEYIKTFNEHSEYQGFMDGGGGALPNTSYCRKEKDVHYNPLRALKFTANGEQTIKINNNGNSPNLEYSIDYGRTWTQWNYSSVTFGNGIVFFVRGNNPEGFSKTNTVWSRFVFGKTGVTVECCGNVMHLLSYTNDLEEIPNSHCFTYLFYDNRVLIKAPELPATTLKANCYYRMFSNSSALIMSPELPATVLPASCYEAMFSGCTSLVTPPELSATSADSRCYQSMFAGCTSLTTAPVLIKPTIGFYQYYHMFSGCTSLTYVKCLATPNATYQGNWLAGVSPTGTFVKKTGTNWPTGPSGIPEGWTVEEV